MKVRKINFQQLAENFIPPVPDPGYDHFVKLARTGEFQKLALSFSKRFPALPEFPPAHPALQYDYADQDPSFREHLGNMHQTSAAFHRLMQHAAMQKDSVMRQKRRDNQDPVHAKISAMIESKNKARFEQKRQEVDAQIRHHRWMVQVFRQHKHQAMQDLSEIIDSLKHQRSQLNLIQRHKGRSEEQTKIQNDIYARLEQLLKQQDQLNSATLNMIANFAGMFQAAHAFAIDALPMANSSPVNNLRSSGRPATFIQRSRKINKA